MPYECTWIMNKSNQIKSNIKRRYPPQATHNRDNITSHKPIDCIHSISQNGVTIESTAMLEGRSETN